MFAADHVGGAIFDCYSTLFWFLIITLILMAIGSAMRGDERNKRE